MGDKINPNKKNHLSIKEVAKRTAALTLLLSTTACTGGEIFGTSLLIFFFGPGIIGLGIELINKIRKEKEVEEYKKEHPNTSSDPEYVKNIFKTRPLLKLIISSLFLTYDKLFFTTFADGICG
jgi:hypothetical protein